MNCAFCATIFVRDRSKVGQGRQIYCGIECAGDVIAIKQSYRYRSASLEERAAIMLRARTAKAQSTQRSGNHQRVNTRKDYGT